MRRCLNAFLVGVLTLSMSMNAARACWYLRHGCHTRHHVVVVYPPAIRTIPAGVAGAADACCGEWGDPVVDACGDWPVVADVAVGESFEAGASSCDCGGGVVVLESETLVAEHDGVSHDGVSSVVGPEVEHLAANEHAVADDHGGHEVAESIAPPQPTRADPVAEKPAPVSALVPNLKPTDEVRQAVALGEPEPKPEVVLPAEPPMEEDVPEPKEESAAVEPNIFEEVEQAAQEPTAVEDNGGTTNASEEASGSELAPEDAPAGDTPAETPAEEPAPAEQSAADPLADFRGIAREPARRWIDRSGDYAVVGTLRAVRGDGTCVLEAAGRTIEVPLEALSDFDRTYVTAAAERLAGSAPESGDTAGL